MYFEMIQKQASTKLEEIGSDLKAMLSSPRFRLLWCQKCYAAMLRSTEKIGDIQCTQGSSMPASAWMLETCFEYSFGIGSNSK